MTLRNSLNLSAQRSCCRVVFTAFPSPMNSCTYDRYNRIGAHSVYSIKRQNCSMFTHLSHDGDGRLVSGRRHFVLDQVEHVLVIQQSDQMERAEAGGAAQRQVADHHRTATQTNTCVTTSLPHHPGGIHMPSGRQHEVILTTIVNTMQLYRSSHISQLVQ